jgi:hypothetical protein
MTKPRSSSGAESWQEHEHVVPHIRAQAQKLLDEAGSLDLAKHAVDAPAKPQAAPDSAHDQFARQVGFASYLALFEASTPLTSAMGKQWLLTALRHDQWILWNDTDLSIAGTYPTREAVERDFASLSSRESGD